MKECLYRGRDIYTKELVEGILIQGVRTYIATKQAIEDMIVSVAYMAGIRLVEVDPTTVSEFTGCTDLNGTRIFTNDKVYEGCNGLIGTVIWDEKLGTYRLDIGETYLIADARVEWIVLKDVKSKHVGRIEYLGPTGKIVERIEYKDEKEFIEKIREATYSGAPIRIALYKDINGKHISKDFIKELDPPPHGVYTTMDPRIMLEEN